MSRGATCCALHTYLAQKPKHGSEDTHQQHVTEDPAPVEDFVGSVEQQMMTMPRMIQATDAHGCDRGGSMNTVQNSTNKCGNAQGPVAGKLHGSWRVLRAETAQRLQRATAAANAENLGAWPFVYQRCSKRWL